MENGKSDTVPAEPDADVQSHAVKPGEIRDPRHAGKFPNGHVAVLQNGAPGCGLGDGGSAPAPGVESFPDSLETCEGSALQSLRLSIPMQETELSHEPSLEMENEEKIRLEARRRLEEQLKQYRVQRHQERSHRSSHRSRPSSTLDPELMLHPDVLPRASAVAMTTEYSFLRTSVPRGPKLGSLGIPLTKTPKQRSRAPRPGNIRSLADYRTPDTPGEQTTSSSVGGGSVGGVSEGSPSSVSTVSTLSEEGGVTEALPVKEEASVGSYPSLREVLLAANEELEQEKAGGVLMQSEVEEVESEPRSRRDSFSSTLSFGSSVMGTQEELLQVLKEKTRLEGQLESLSSEASQALKEKTELQAELAALDARLRAQCEETRRGAELRVELTSEVSALRSERSSLRRGVAELRAGLEEKDAGLESLSKDLQLAEQQYQRLMGRVEELQQSLSTRDGTVSDLQQQVKRLHSELQQVECERGAVSSRLQTAQAEVQSLQQLRSWYQQQLAVAQEARVRLQAQMASMQAGHMTQIDVLENLKMENVSLSHQLTESKHRSIKEKERIAVQLQSIEVDMLTQEANIHQIHDAKALVEKDLQQKLQEFEEEREQLHRAANRAAALERELEQVRALLAQKEAQLWEFQQEHVELMKKLTETQDALQSKDQALQLVEARYEQLRAELDELQADSSTRDQELRLLQEQKIVLEVALQAAREEHGQLGDGAEKLGQEVLDSSEALEQLRQEVQVKSTQISSLQQENASLRKQAQKLKEQFGQQKVMLEAYRRDAASKEQLITELKSSKKRLLSEVKELKEALQRHELDKRSSQQEQERLLQEGQRVQEQMSSLEEHLQEVQRERDQLDSQLQALQFDQDQMRVVSEENEVLRKKVEEMQKDAKKSISEQKGRMKRLGTDLSSAQKELKVKHKAYENAVSILSRRLQEALGEKEAAEAELLRLRAQVEQGGNSHALQVKVDSLQEELDSVMRSKTLLEKELQEVISLTSAELEEYQEKVLELEDELQEARNFKKRIRRLEEANKKLTLELEHERGRLAGLGTSHNALREHSNVLEAALAKREADLVQLNLQVQAVLKRKEEEDQQMRNLVQTLQDALEKKIKVKELTEQVAEVKLEAAHNRRHYRAAVLELNEIKRELQTKEELLISLQNHAHNLQSQDAQRSQEVSRFESELAEARTQLQILQKHLDDELNKQPLINQEVEDLKWEVEQKQRALDAQRHQVELSEISNQKELDTVQETLQRVRVELDMVQEELSGTRKDKFVLQAKVGELRNSMKNLLQQNTQLKQELKHHRTRKRVEVRSDSAPLTPVKIPDCPVPASLLDELLKPSASVNKEPLNNLHNCLRQLKQEMDSLQKQMEEHTVTVTTWVSTEEELQRLEINDNSSKEAEEGEEKVLSSS